MWIIWCECTSEETEQLSSQCVCAPLKERDSQPKGPMRVGGMSISVLCSLNLTSHRPPFSVPRPVLSWTPFTLSLACLLSFSSSHPLSASLLSLTTTTTTTTTTASSSSSSRPSFLVPGLPRTRTCLHLHLHPLLHPHPHPRPHLHSHSHSYLLLTHFYPAPHCLFHHYLQRRHQQRRPSYHPLVLSCRPNEVASATTTYRPTVQEMCRELFAPVVQRT